jgi:hypothetical protein
VRTALAYAEGVMATALEDVMATALEDVRAPGLEGLPSGQP